MNVSKVMKELRVERKKTQKEVAKYLGITRPAYVRYETDQREPGLEVIDKLAKYYQVPPQIFFMRKFRMKPSKELFISELGAMYEYRKIELRDMATLLMANKIEKSDNFPHNKKNDIPEEEIPKYKKAMQVIEDEIELIRKIIIEVLEEEATKKYYENWGMEFLKKGKYSNG